MTLPSPSEVEQTLASFEGCLPEILNAKYALAGRQLVEWVRELSAEVERTKRMVADFPKLMEFFTRNALPSLDEPSCLMCGHVGERSTTHNDLPNIYICKTCVAERDRLSAQLSVQADEVELYIAALDTAKETEAAQSERIAALEMDAARYLWWRDHAWFYRGEFCLQSSWPRFGEIGTKGFDSKQAAVDAAIDAARLDASSGIEHIEPESPLGKQESQGGFSKTEGKWTTQYKP